MLVVLDTNHFREVAEATIRAAHFNRRAEEERAEVFLSIITVQEAANGWLALINSLTAGRNQVRSYASFQKTITAFHANFAISLTVSSRRAQGLDLSRKSCLPFADSIRLARRRMRPCRREAGG